jgi:hypothetical protein
MHLNLKKDTIEQPEIHERHQNPIVSNQAGCTRMVCIRYNSNYKLLHPEPKQGFSAKVLCSQVCNHTIYLLW